MIKLEVKNNKNKFEEIIIDDKLNVSSSNKILQKFVNNLIVNSELDTTGADGSLETQICNYIKKFYQDIINIKECKPVLYSYNYEVQGFKDEENLIKDENKKLFWGKVKGLLVKDEFRQEDHPRNKLGIFIKKLRSMLFKEDNKIVDFKKDGRTFIKEVYLTEGGDLDGIPFSQKEIRNKLEKWRLPDNFNELEDLYDEIELLKDEYSDGGKLTKYAIEYWEKLVNKKYKSLNGEKNTLIKNILSNSIKRVPVNENDN